MSEVKWIKLDANIFDNRKIKMIGSMPNGDGIIVMWLKLLCLAGSINDSGLVYFTKEIPYTDQMMATQFNMPLTTVQVALQTFQQFGMIELVDDLLLISNWEKYQNIEGMERMKEQRKEINARYYQKKKLLLEAAKEPEEEIKTSYKTSYKTDSDGTDIDKNKIKNKINTKDSDPFIVYQTDNPDLFQALKAFEEMRKAAKKPLTVRSKNLLLSKLGSFPDEQWIPLLNQSIEHCWASVYPLKEAEHKGKNFYCSNNPVSAPSLDDLKRIFDAI